MTDEEFMRIAIDEAKKALEEGEGIGFGAVIVKDGEIISATHNNVLKDTDPTSHGEINAIREASKKLDSKDLAGCILYSTCEPCPMCFTAAWWANISRLVYGVSLEDVAGVSKEILVGSEFLNRKGDSKIEILGGLLKEECLKLYK